MSGRLSGPQAVQTLWELCPPSPPGRAREELGPLGSTAIRFVQHEPPPAAAANGPLPAVSKQLKGKQFNQN